MALRNFVYYTCHTQITHKSPYDLTYIPDNCNVGDWKFAGQICASPPPFHARCCYNILVQEEKTAQIYMLTGLKIMHH